MELSEQRGTSTVALYGAPIAGGNGSAGAGADAQLLDVKLYDEPHAQVNPSCDMYTHLGLKRDGAAISASVEFKLSATSTCEPYVAPNERTFGVTQSDDGCGSKVYTGTSGADRIVITDNTHRLCEDLRPARIEVDLTRDGQTSHLFSPE